MRATDLLDRLCDEWGYDREDFLSKSRPYPMSWHRQIAIFLYWNRGDSQATIANLFRRTTSAIYHSVRAVEDRISVDKKAADEWRQIVGKVKP
jgi:chromosomal replication initiation ATPase DnaA